MIVYTLFRFEARNKYGDWMTYAATKETAHYVTGVHVFTGETKRFHKSAIRRTEETPR